MWEIIGKIDWTNVISNVGIFGIAAFFIKKAFVHYLSKDLEKFKIRYSRLHSQRTKVIKELYSHISELQLMYKQLCSPVKSMNFVEEKEEDLVEKANNLSKEFVFYFEKNKIYLREEESDKIDKIREMFSKTGTDYSISKIYQDKNEKRKGAEKMHEAWKKVNEEIDEAKQELKKNFQEAIGLNKNVSEND